jgi:hypothetical protein
MRRAAHWSGVGGIADGQWRVQMAGRIVFGLENRGFSASGVSGVRVVSDVTGGCSQLHQRLVGDFTFQALESSYGDRNGVGMALRNS